MSVSRRLPGDAATNACSAGWWEGEPLHMYVSRTLSVCLCAVVTFVSVTGASLLEPVPVMAASGTLTMATPLQDSPDPSATMIVLLAPGAVVSIDGPPVDGFYPVSVDGYSGWMRGETMSVAKDIPPAEEPATPLAEDWGTPADGEIPMAQDAGGEWGTAQELSTPDDDVPAPVADAASAQPATNDGYTAAEPVVTDTASGADGVTQAPDAVVNPAPAETGEWVEDPAAAPADASVVPGAPDSGVVDPSATGDAPVVTQTDGPEPSDPVVATHPDPVLVSATVTEPPVQSGEATTTTDPAAAPVAATETPVAAPADATTQTLVDPAASPTPAPDAAAPATETPTAAGELAPSPTPTPEPPIELNGPAYVIVDMPVRDGPGDHFGLVFTVPAGSSLLRTGGYEAGWISVQYKEVYGWARAEHMSEPIEVKEEEPLSEVVSTKEPKPGSGVAFTTADLSLRSGPSASEEPIVVVPAGSRVILTGVMEGEYQRVTYGEYVGWLSNSYLENPDDPAPNGQGKGKQKNYSRKQIVKYIYQAADRYGQSREDMLRVATCESGLDPYAVNPSGSYGLFQFIRSTWKSTPYGKEDIFDPKYNSLAAAWMWQQGRKSEWVCQ